MEKSKPLQLLQQHLILTLYPLYPPLQPILHLPYLRSLMNFVTRIRQSPSKQRLSPSLSHPAVEMV